MTRRKLTPEQVADVLQSEESNAVLARRFGVGSRTIRDVREGRSYIRAQEAIRSPGSRRCVCGRRFKPAHSNNYLCPPCLDVANAGDGLPSDWVAAGGGQFDDKIHVVPGRSDQENEVPTRRPTAAMTAKAKRQQATNYRSSTRERALDEAMELDDG